MIRAPWPHQTRGVNGIATAISDGFRRPVLTSPTGTGKSVMVQMIIEWGRPTLVLCHRSMLMEQWAIGFDEAKLDFGMQASGYAPGVFENLQLGMLQTVIRRWEDGKEELPYAEIVIIDEIHAFSGPSVQRLIEEYTRRGATVVLVTATPLGIGHLADELITAAVTSEGRACGALLPAVTYAPTDIDSRAYKRTIPGILQIADEYRDVMLKVICGKVIEYYREYNPHRKPAILFAPGVQEARWFTDEFINAGIPWSHIDSDKIILNGEILEATRDNRLRLLAASKSGETKGISNRFVLREGIDAPWLYHGIFACTVGGLTAWLQMGGRLLRNHESLDEVIIQDHGGNYWRHGSLNADRVWHLEDTDKKVAEERAKRLRGENGPKEPEPFPCPKCSAVRTTGAVCPKCGFAYKGKKRMVVQTDGTLRPVYGDIFRPRKVCTDPEAHKKWRACVYRCRNSGRTYTQARGLFMHENHGAVPGPDFPMMPKYEADWGQKVKDVPYERLTDGLQRHSET